MDAVEYLVMMDGQEAQIGRRKGDGEVKTWRVRGERKRNEGDLENGETLILGARATYAFLARPTSMTALQATVSFTRLAQLLLYNREKICRP